MSSPLTIINPSEREYSLHRFVLSFGQHGPTHLMVYGNLDDALEACAEWLCEHAPGLVYKKGNGADKRDPQLDEWMAEVCEEKGLAWPIPDDVDWSDSDAMQPYWDAEQEAFADLTECGDCYIGSDEWCITLEDPSRAELMAFIQELAERHYDESVPVVAVAGVHDRKPAEPSKPQTHWVVGGGSVGCLYDYGPETCETADSAVESAAFIYELTEEEKATLAADHILYFEGERRAEAGADYVEISEQPGPCPDSDE